MDNVLGQVRLSQGDKDAAAQLFTDGLASARRAQDWLPLAHFAVRPGVGQAGPGRLVGAAGHLQEGLALAAEAGDETRAAYYLEILAAVAGQQDNPQRPYACSLPPARSWTPGAAAGSTPSCHASRTTIAVLAALRSRIGDPAFQEAQAWDGSAGSKRAVEFALERA